jgi:hypothetical protein
MPEDFDTLTDEQRELVKDAIKEAASEWLDRQFAAVGKWGVAAIAGMLLSWLVYLTFHAMTAAAMHPVSR